MQVNISRMKKWDWGVVIGFVVTIVGVSIPWWKAQIGDLFGGLGELGGLVSGVDVPSANAFGWDMDGGVAAFVFALFVTIWVFAKILLPADKPLPKWYMEAWPVMVIGGILTLIGIIGTADAPAGGYDFWAWRPGGLITLAAAVIVLYCGYMMYRDKSGDYGMSPEVNVDAIKKAVMTQEGAQAQPGAQAPPAAQAPPEGGKFCTNCGSPVQPGDTNCKNCGKAL